MSPSPRITVRLAEDALEAFVDVAPGPPADAAELREALERAGVREGLQDATLESLAEALACADGAAPNASVAVGLAPRHGDDAWLEPAFDAGLAPGRLRRDGSLDYRERGLVQRVREGDAVAHWHAATRGEDGRGVDGRRLAAEPGKDGDPPLGEGVTLHPDGSIRAARTGATRFSEDGSLQVVDLLVHAGDVDLRSGNLTLDGSLQIQGSVHATMRVRATRDLEIAGALEGGSAVAGGRLQIGGGVRPGSAARAGNTLVTARVQGARLRAGADLEVATESVDAELHAKQIRIGRRVVGGQVLAESGIRVGDAGTPAGGPVTLRAAAPLLDPRGRARGARTAPRAEARGDRAARGGRASREARARTRDEARRRDADLRRLREWRRRQRDLARRAVIDVEGRVHPGVTIEIGTARHPVESGAARVRFRLDPETRRILEESLPS